MKHILPAAIASLAVLILSSCASSSKVEMPTGTSKGYSSARLVKGKDNTTPAYADGRDEVNNMIQQALAENFKGHGMQVGNSDADLVVGYMLVVQNNVSTRTITDFYGYGRDASAIANRAHEVGVIENGTPDYYKAGSIVIDVMDAKTNKLVYRHYATRNIQDNASAMAKQQKINSAVSEAMGGFWR